MADAWFTFAVGWTIIIETCVPVLPEIISNRVSSPHAAAGEPRCPRTEDWAGRNDLERPATGLCAKDHRPVCKGPRGPSQARRASHAHTSHQRKRQEAHRDPHSQPLGQPWGTARGKSSSQIHRAAGVVEKWCFCSFLLTNTISTQVVTEDNLTGWNCYFVWEEAWHFQKRHLTVRAFQC